MRSGYVAIWKSVPEKSNSTALTGCGGSAARGRIGPSGPVTGLSVMVLCIRRSGGYADAKLPPG